MLRTWQRQVSSLTKIKACHANWKYFDFAFHSSSYLINLVCPNCKYVWIPHQMEILCLSVTQRRRCQLTIPTTHRCWHWWCASLLWPPIFPANLQEAFPRPSCSFVLSCFAVRQWPILLRLSGPTGRQSTCFMNQEIARQGNSRQCNACLSPGLNSPSLLWKLLSFMRITNEYWLLCLLFFFKTMKLLWRREICFGPFVWKPWKCKFWRFWFHFYILWF